MGVDYTMKIKRACDGKILGEIFCNVIKGAFEADVHFVENDDRVDSFSFNFPVIHKMIKCLYNELDILEEKRYSKRLELLVVKSNMATENINDEISYLKEKQEIICDAIDCLNHLKGEIAAIVEDNIVDEMPAYERNGKDLPLENERQMNFVFSDDVICEVTANY